MKGPIRLEFVKSVDALDGLVASLAEVAIVGRSNVGKSSLINAVAGRKNLAETSKTPGRTRLLNMYRLPTGATIVDCPGYGFARAATRDRADWMDLVEEYLLRREVLMMVAVLVDGAVGPTDLDQGMLEWLRHEVVPHTVVATKMDKVKSSRLTRRKRELAELCILDPDDVVWTSATKNQGIDRLRGLIMTWLET